MVTPGLGPGYAVGKKGKKRSQIGKISASEASRAVRSPIFFFSFIPRRFSPPFSLTHPQSFPAEPGPRLGPPSQGPVTPHRLNSLYKYVT